MSLALGVKRLFEEVGILPPYLEDIDNMSEGELLSLLRERNILLRIIELYSLDQSKIDYQNSERYRKLRDRINALFPESDMQRSLKQKIYSMNLAIGVKRLFEAAGVLLPTPEEIDNMSEDELQSLLKEREIPLSFVQWYSMEPSDIAPGKLEAYEELKPAVDQFIRCFTESENGLQESQPDIADQN